MKKYLQILLSGVISGIFIGMGVVVYLATLALNFPGAKVVGSLLFGFGLYAVIIFETFLYTGKVGFVLDNKPKYFLDLLVGLIGNFVGIISFCGLISLTKYGTDLQNVAVNLVNGKLNDSWYSILILSIFCGFMIYLGVVGHKKCDNPFGKVVICFLAVSLFILGGFEHCVANAGYFTIARTFSWKALGYFLLMILGNGIGAVLLDGMFKLLTKLKESKKESN